MGSILLTIRNTAPRGTASRPGLLLRPGDFDSRKLVLSQYAGSQRSYVCTLVVVTMLEAVYGKRKGAFEFARLRVCFQVTDAQQPLLLLVLSLSTLKTAKAVKNFHISADWASVFCMRVSA